VGGKGALDHPIQQEEVDRETPYNTYKINGLPPTPIANPGRAAIEAVLRPAKSRDLYFVADGTGGHVFAPTLDDHNRNVVKWRKVEREIRAREASEAALKAAQEAAADPAAAAAAPTGALTAAPQDQPAPNGTISAAPADPMVAPDAFADPAALNNTAHPFAGAEGESGGAVPTPPRNPKR
jgi:UPF0755 protein